MAKKEKQPFVDDGRTVANMNLPGMPWYLDKPKTNKTQPGDEPETLAEMNLTKGERRAIIKGVMMAVLPIGLVFGVAYFLIFLFIDLVWLA